MYLQSIQGLSGNKSNDVAFKSRFVIEGGGSNKKTGSLKMLVQTNAGEDLFVRTGVINDEDPKGFHGNDHFNKLVAKAANVEDRLQDDINNLQKQLDENHLLPETQKKLEEKLATTKTNLNIWKELPEEEKAISKIALLLPGTIRGKRASFLPNILKTDGKPLCDINLMGVITEIRKQGKAKLAPKFNARYDFVPLKDLGATGVEMAYKLIHNPELNKRTGKGLFAVVSHCGGGFGSADIRFKSKGEIAVQTNESGHDLYFDPRTGKETRLGKMGASVGCVIENFATKFGITNKEDIDALMATGNAQMATQKQITLKTQNDSKAIDVLLNSKAYKVVSKNSESTILSLKDEALERFMQGSKHAVDYYAYAHRCHAINKINQGANLYIVSSPLTMGMNQVVTENPSMFGGAKDLRELILMKINEKVGSDFTCNKLRKDDTFDVICNPKMSIKDNTFGGSIILSGKTSFERRGEWIEVDKKVLKGLVRKAARAVK